MSAENLLVVNVLPENDPKAQETIQVLKQSSADVQVLHAYEKNFRPCVGCNVCGMLLSMDSLCGEPVCLWLPERFKKPNTSAYVQGVEVTEDYTGPVPEGFDVIWLSAADYLMFQGEPFAEEDYCDAISAVQQAMNGYDPDIIGCCWDDSNPRIQLEPRGNRGYIEIRAVKKK